MIINTIEITRSILPQTLTEDFGKNLRLETDKSRITTEKNAIILLEDIICNVNALIDSVREILYS